MNEVVLLQGKDALLRKCHFLVVQRPVLEMKNQPGFYLLALRDLKRLALSDLFAGHRTHAKESVHGPFGETHGNFHGRN